MKDGYFYPETNHVSGLAAAEPFDSGKTIKNGKSRVNVKPMQSRAELLTQRTVDRAQPRHKEYTIYHKSLTGFGLRIRPSGHKSFILIYKNELRRTTKHVIGDPDLLSLSEAEDLAREAKRKIKDGLSPNIERSSNEEQTLDSAFTEYLADHGTKLSLKWRNQSEQIYNKYIAQRIGSITLDSVTRRDLIDCIKAVPTIAVQNHVRAILSSVYSWCVDAEYVDKNLVQGVRCIRKLPSRERVLSNSELASAWHISTNFKTPYREYVQFLMLSGQRLREVANMQWSEINWEEKIWILPADRSKNRNQHTIPLTDRMIEILEGLSRDSKFVFPSPSIPTQPITSFRKVVERLRGTASKENWRFHDLRRTLATRMAMIGIAPHIIEAVLNHRSGMVSGVTAIYNRYDYIKEKREALECVHAHLSELFAKHVSQKGENIICIQSK